MTYIEFFDTSPAKNICTCLTRVPERVIFIGSNPKRMHRHVEKYRQIFQDRGQTVEFIVKSTSQSNLGNAVKLLTEIVEEYEDCVFDITGGAEILLVALGIVCQRYPKKNIQIHRFNLQDNTLHDCDQDGVTVYDQAPALTVEEQIRVYGGEILYGTVEEENTYCWEITEDFIRDTEKMWSVCKADPQLWNVQIGVFEALEKVGETSADGLETSGKITAVKTQLIHDKGKYVVVRGLIQRMRRMGLLTAFEEDGQRITVAYKDPQVKRCMTKAGQALEMRVFLAARALREDGEPVYNDVVNGVTIDWDGEIHDEQGQNDCNTKNEIDVLLMRGTIPVFVSCKNGQVRPEELYKFNTVAKRFGSNHARMALVAAGYLGAQVRQRAEDMGIKLIEDVRNLSDGALAKELKQLWR